MLILFFMFLFYLCEDLGLITLNKDCKEKKKKLTVPPKGAHPHLSAHLCHVAFFFLLLVLCTAKYVMNLLLLPVCLPKFRWPPIVKDTHKVA